MKLRSSLIAGAAAAALLSLSLAPQAHAASKNTDAVIAAQAAEIDALKQEMQMLKARLDAQDARQAQVEQQASQAAATAQAVQAQTASEIQSIPTRVETAVAAAAPKPKESWADNTKISGRMYYNITHIEAENNGVKVAPTGTGFEIKRFYVGIDHKFNDIYSANITTDMNYVSNDGETQVYLKKAYLQAKYSDALVVRLGSTDLPWVPFAEGVYGYRFVENELVDRAKFGTSADWGVHVSGKVGMFEYAAAVIDGAGYKKPLRSKSMDFEGRVSTTMEGFTAGVGVYTGKLGNNVEGGADYRTATRWDAILGYKASNFNVGVEYFTADDWGISSAMPSDKADGWSLFGSYKFTSTVAAFTRYDAVKPSKDLDSSLKDEYFNVGLVWSPTKIVDFAMVYKRDELKGNTTDKTSDEIGLFGQLRW